MLLQFYRNKHTPILNNRLLFNIYAFKSTTYEDSFFDEEAAVMKSNKKAIASHFKNKIQLYKQLLESKDQLLESKEQQLKQLLENKEQLLEIKVRDAKLKNVEISNANLKYLKIKGILNIRGLLEEYEQSDLFQKKN